MTTTKQANQPARQTFRLTLTNTWKRRLHIAGRVGARIVLVVLVVSSTINGINIVWHTVFPPPPPPIATIARHVVGQADLAKAFAVDCVTSYLTASTTQTSGLSRCFPNADKLTVPSTPGLIVSWPAAYAAPKGPNPSTDVDTYSVTVGLTQQHYPTDTPVRAYYQIPISVYYDSGPRALDNLTPIDSPPAGVDVQLRYPVAITDNSALAAMLSGFITCYLTKSTGLERFITTDSGLHPLNAYASATVTAMQAIADPPDNPVDGTMLRVHLTVSAHSTEYTPYDWSYPLTLRANGGAWFVAAIDAVPALSDSAPNPAPAN